jgi:glucose/arabinose dehydrogenase
VLLLVLAVAATSPAPLQMLSDAATEAAQAPGLVPVLLAVPPALQRVPPLDRPRTVFLPPGFRIAAYAAGLGAPRQLAFSPNGVLFAANVWAGEVLALADRDGDGVIAPGEKAVFQAGLWAPHSLFFEGTDLYVGAHNAVMRFADADGDLVPDGPGHPLVALPLYGDQITRTVVRARDGRLYVGIGSTTNAGLESDPRRGAVMRYEADGSGETVLATGLRNPVGMAFHPTSGELWTTEVGADHLGEEHPLEELNIIRPGAHYGWPYCYEDRVPDLGLYSLDAPGFCPRTVPPVATFRAHSTPLGLLFYAGGQLPPEYRGRAFVAFHGSSKRVVQTGYGVLTVEIGPQGENPHVEDFATGWLLDPSRTPDQPGQNWGRPVHLTTGPDGALYLSDDAHGAIYRIWYEP